MSRPEELSVDFLLAEEIRCAFDPVLFHHLLLFIHSHFFYPAEGNAEIFIALFFPRKVRRK